MPTHEHVRPGHLGMGLLLVCLGAAAGQTQEGRPLPAAAPVADGAEETNLEQRLQDLRTELRDAERAARDAQRKADTPAAMAKARAINPWKAMAERFDALAFEAEGSDVAAGAWATILTNELRYGSQEKAGEAFGVLVYDHTDSPELDDALGQVQYASFDLDARVEGLAYLVDMSTRREVCAASLFTLAKLLEQADATRDKALGHYRRLVADYGEMDAGRGSTYADKAGAAIFEAERLQVGMPVPDMASIDETQTAFQLSDYKGKVVLLDFWGFW